MSVRSATPVIVGVGQYTDRFGSADYRQLSAVELAAQACLNAVEDTEKTQAVLASIDAIVTTRTFEDSTPARGQPFGKSNNFPRSIAARLGIKPRLAVWDKAGGDSPQRLVSEFCEQLSRGECSAVLIAGAENISTVRELLKAGGKADWAEQPEGDVQDRGMGLAGMMTQETLAHGLRGAPVSYALAENARRARLGLTREAYAAQIGELFAPFTAVAADNPYSAFKVAPLRAEALTSADERNEMIAEPYRRRLIAQDRVNQAAALVLTTVETARKLGVPEVNWVYLHGYADLTERPLMEREDLGDSPAAKLALKAALDAANVTVHELGHFDFYSCFPIAVSNAACDGLGLRSDDPRKLTVTGGLPYFGGPGNNYSMHAIATMVERLRKSPGQFGLVGANGGILSKYSVGIYSATPREWKSCDSSAIQAAIDAVPAPAFCHEPHGGARIETYTVAFERGERVRAIIVGRLLDSGRRFLANTFDADVPTLSAMLDEDPLGRDIQVVSTAKGNRFTFGSAHMAEIFPVRKPIFRTGYEYCTVKQDGHLLEVAINRPEASNSLTPMANEELAEIFDAYEADPNLWVAILYGAGGAAFCAGADLKYGASGKPVWLPKQGFGGLTHRQRDKPVIAAVNGFAMGGGLEICLACDIVVADETAKFALSEVKVGVIAGTGGLVRLPRQMPRKKAYELILTGRKFGARDAERWGIVNGVVPAGEAVCKAREIAAEILEASPTAVRLSMKAMQQADQWPVATEALANRDRAVIDELITSEDFFEGPSAFAQKRKPQWKNR
ncbi:enoyl-CoA hydratase-related protein [Paraburkholderia phytofirmans]|uniref:enoyl-CoA hydratase-related protein n=1 Tax=Paraburkholderia phytofirmans TaxID=261302 RepID=UPI0038B858A3